MLEPSKRQMNNSKKNRRKENKKKKLGALLEISKLNDDDRKKSLLRKSSMKSDESSEEKQSEEPKPKRQRTEYAFPLNGEKVPTEVISPVIKIKSSEKTGANNKWKSFRRRKERPFLELSDIGEKADLKVPSEQRAPLKMEDFQHFLIYSLLGNMTTKGLSRWIQLKKMEKVEKRIFMVLEGAGVNEFLENAAELKVLTEFQHRLEVMTPLALKGSIVEELASVRLTETQRRKLGSEYASLKDALKSGAAYRTVKSMFPFHKATDDSKIPTENSQPEHAPPRKVVSNTDKFSRKSLILSEWEMLEEDYPFPWPGELGECYKGFQFTHESYKEVEDSSPMWALDCEMCLTPCGQEVTRVCIINEAHEIVYESLVKPYNPIWDYKTRYSGITPKMLLNVQTRLEDVQKAIRAICPPDLILVGQSLNFDLKALRMMHPHVIDTSLVFNLSGDRKRKTKLRILSEEFLSERIQADVSGHNPVEDALACMKLIQAKLHKSLSWGNAVLGFKRDEREAEAARVLLEERVKQGVVGESKSLKQVSWPQLCGIRRSETGKQEEQSASGGGGSTGRGPVDNDSARNILGTSLFSHLVRYDKTVLMVGKLSTMRHYADFFPPEMQRLNTMLVTTDRAAVRLARDQAPLHGVAMLHLKSEKLHRSPREAIIKADKLVGKMMKKLEPNTLLVVLLAGRYGVQNNGLIFLHLLRERIS